jgi:uncharacterized membrane protein
MRTMPHDTATQLAERLLQVGFQDMTVHERHVIEKVAARMAVARDLTKEPNSQQSFGEWLADRVADFGGSWTFLMAFAGFIFIWVIFNVLFMGFAFDQYPFILLNLFMSMLASIQAPIIMMSQNRQAAKDRKAAAHDYEVNLKAEIEIMALHEKLDEIRAKDLAQLLQQKQPRGLPIK